jgi:protein ImuB
LLFQTQDMSRLYNNQEHYWQSLQKPLQARHLSYYYAAAHTPLAAQTLALAHANQFCRSLAEVEGLLNQLPITAAGLSQTLTAQLQRLGLHLLGQVRELSRPALGKKLGADLVQHLQQLDQDQQPKVPVYQPKEYFSQQLPLLYEVEQSPALRFPLSRLLQDMEVFLHNRQLQVARLKLGLISRQQETIWLHIGSGGGEYLAKVWLELVMLRIEQITLKAPIISLHLKGCQQTARTALTQSLFEPSQGQQLTPGQLLGRLQNRLGVHGIQQLGLRHDYRPEHSAYSSQIPISISHRRNNRKHQPIDSLRPSILLPLPQMLAAKPGSGWQFLQGPERIQSGWWDNRAICRDYFIVRNGQGQLCWLFRNHQEEWFLHGYFA